MKTVSVIREKMEGEKRVIMLPENVNKLVRKGYRVLVETGAGKTVGYTDNDYITAGAVIANEKQAWEGGDLILKYKPPIPEEYQYIKEGQTIAALCHAEGNYKLIKEFMKKKCNVYTFEFFETEDANFPLSIPGGEIAGKVAMLYAMYYSQTHLGGSGRLPVKVVGATKPTIGVIGYGNVGSSVIRMALDLGNNVIIFGHNIPKMKKMAIGYGGNIKCCLCSEESLFAELKNIDILFGAILISTYNTDPVVTKEMIDGMKNGSVIVDVTCGYGPGYMPFLENNTSLDDPILKKDGKTFIKIDNLPAAFHMTTTEAYTSNIEPYILQLCDRVFENKTDHISERGMIFKEGKIVHKVIEEHFKYYERNII